MKQEAAPSAAIVPAPSSPPGSSTRRSLLARWLAGHALGNAAPLFASLAPDYALTPQATRLLQGRGGGEMALYVLCEGDPTASAVPLYVGKSAEPWKRWHAGHLRHLRRANLRPSGASYDRWVRELGPDPAAYYLLCVSQAQVLFPALPDFPRTIGSLEYQLVALADDAYPGRLLNHEGAAR